MIGADYQKSGAALAIGLSHVHISSMTGPIDDTKVIDAALRYGGSITGRYCDEVVRAPFSPDREIAHPAGCYVSSPYHDNWISVRRWRDGISIGEGTVFDLKRKTRGTVGDFSEGARSRMLRYLREARADYKMFGTLTVGQEYGDAKSFRKVVDRWLVFALRAMQRAAKERYQDPAECSIFWFIEFQARGAPHLHIFYTHYVNWAVFAFGWARICGRFGFCDADQSRVERFSRTSTRFERFRSGFRGVLSYARKYAAKSEQKQAPTGYWQGRFWGVRGLRSRGSCHVVATRRTDAYKPFKRLRSYLDDMVSAGLMRKFPWSRGDGAVYALIRGQFTDLPKDRLQIERELAWMISLLNSGSISGTTKMCSKQ